MMVKAKAARTQPLAAAAAADTQRALEIVDTTFDCASAVLNTALAVATIEAPPIAAGFAFSAITSATACSTKLALISSAASPQQYRQAACALELLNPTGMMVAVAGVGLGVDHCSVGAWGNTGADLAGLVGEAGNADYVLGNLSRGRWPLAFLFAVVLLKTGWNAAGTTGDDAPSSSPSNPGGDPGEGGANADHLGSSDGFVPRGGPGRHPEP